MKILLDECLPVDLRHCLPSHVVFTVTYMGWSGIKNGALIARAASDGFDVIITNDQAFDRHAGAQPAVSVLIIHAKSNDLDELTPLLPDITRALAALPPNSVVRVG